jgi:DNA-binding NarL/FixJ family response regulator
MRKIRVLLADDHAVLREGLAMLINDQPEMEVVAQAATGSEAVRCAQSAAPDVAVLDISMPEGGGASVAEELRVRCPAVRVVALTRHADQAYVRRLLQAGAAGYILKKSAAETLISAIRIVAEGGSYIEPSLAAVAATDIAKRAGLGDSERLTPREQEVLREVAWGRSNKEIAAALALSTKTVESYKASALEKLNLRSRSEIVRYAVARGWMSGDVLPDSDV